MIGDDGSWHNDDDDDDDDDDDNNEDLQLNLQLTPHFHQWQLTGTIFVNYPNVPCMARLQQVHIIIIVKDQFTHWHLGKVSLNLKIDFQIHLHNRY